MTTPAETTPIDAAGGDGRLAGFDPRVRLVSAVVLVASIASLHRPSVLVAALVAGGLAASASGLPLRRLLRRMAHVEGFVVILLATLPFTAGGPTVDIGPLALSEPGLERALVLGLRISAAAMILVGLVAGLPAARLAAALSRLGCPERLVALTMVTLRYLDVIAGEADRMREALRLRAFTPRTDRHTLATYGRLIGQLLVRAHDRAERIADAMRCRAFEGRYPADDGAVLRRTDAAFLAAALAAALALLLVDRLP